MQLRHRVVLGLVIALIASGTFAQEPTKQPARPIAKLNVSVAETWSFEITRTLPGGTSKPMALVDDLIGNIARASDATLGFVKVARDGTVVLTTRERLTTAEVFRLRNQLMTLDDVRSVRTRRLSAMRMAEVVSTAPVVAVGFIVKPTVTAASEGWTDAGNFTPAALVVLGKLTGGALKFQVQR